MSRRFNLLFYLKKPKKYEKGGLMPIYMRVSVGGKRTEFTTQREWDPTKWNSSACRASGTKEASKELNVSWIHFRRKFMKHKGSLSPTGK